MGALGRIALHARVLALALGMLGFSAGAQAQAELAGDDYLFPEAGHFGATLATGVPYVGIVDLTLGLGPHAALGAIFGVTPRVVGLGARPRLALPLGAVETAAFRVYAIAPLLYYPEPSVRWVLARPTLAIEHRTTSDLRLGLGGGLLWASSVDALHGEGTPLSYKKPTEAEIAARRAAREASAAPSSILFWTISASAALEIAQHSAVFAELTTVMEGASLAGDRWTDFGGPPVLVSLGFTYSF
jgi:hypothetical protein